MSFLHKKPFLWGGILVLGLVILPATIFFFQNQQEVRSRAEKTVNLSYQPTSSQTNTPLQVSAGDTFSLDVEVDPAGNSVSFIKVEIDYDPTKFTPTGGFVPNQTAFPQVVDQSTTSGQIIETLSVGSDPSKAITTKTKVGTFSLQALSTVPADTTSVISFGPQSQALSVSSNSSFNENVIANMTPVTIQITNTTTTNATTTTNSCGNAPSDSMLLMDTSSSMNQKAGSSGTKLTNAKTAAQHFVTLASAQTTNRVGLTSFDITAALKSGFTNDFSSVKSKISALTTRDGTCMQCGILKANQEIAAHKRNGIKNAIILLTDGRANMVQGNSNYVSNDKAEKAAIDAATAGHTANGTVIYTIGLGNNVFSDFLRQLATSTGGKYYFTPTTDQLNSIYTQISEELSGGNVSGMVYKAIDSKTPTVKMPFPGVQIQLYPSTSSTKPAKVATSGSDGTYSMDKVCDGQYTLKQVVPKGWKQTVPSNSGYTFTMKNGNAITNKDFGDTQLAPTPTVTPTPQGLTLSLNVFMHGIGNSGDNANPTGTSLSNKNPKTPSRAAKAEIYDINNKFVATASGTIKYSDSSGSFAGNVATSKPVTSGNYTIKVTSDYHLTRLVGGIQNLVANQTNKIPDVTLVAGDVDQNDQLNILDYNLILDCYSDILPAPNCDQNDQNNVKKKHADDLNDDGDVNQYDYNLFVRELSTQYGD